MGRSGGQELVSLSSEFGKHLSSISANILNMNQNSLSGLSVNYIGYFYYVFPLHLNSFNRLFSGVIDPKLNDLKSSTQQLNLLFFHNDINNYKSLFQFIHYYSLNPLFLNLSESFRTFINIVNIGKLLEPYIKIFIHFIDDDITILTDLFSYLNIFNSFYDSLSNNLHYYHKKLINIIIDSRKIESRYHLTFTELSKLIKILNQIKSKMSRFNDYESIRQHYAYIKYKNTSSIKLIRDELKSLKQSLESNKASTPAYIDIINIILKDILSDTIKSYRLTNIEDLAPVIWAPKNLLNLLTNMKDIKNNMCQYQSLLENLGKESSISFDYTTYIISRPIAQLFEYLTQPSLDSLLKYLSDFRYQIYNKYIQQIKLSISQSRDMLKYLFTEVDTVISYIPNLRQKLLRAKSKIDKTKYVQLLLDILEFKNIDSLNKIHDLIGEIHDKSKIQEYIDQSFSNRFNITLTYTIYNLINEERPINFIAHSKNHLSIFYKLKSIDKYINDLDCVNCKLNIQNINVNMEKIRIAIKRIQEVLKEIDFNIISKIEKKIIEIKEIKLYMNNYIYSYKQEYRMKINKILDEIILILNLIKIVIQKLKSFEKKLELSLKSVESSINELECAIEGVPRNFIGCSLQSTSNSMVRVMNDNSDNKLYKQTYGLYSVVKVMNYKVLVNRLFQCAKKIDNIVDVMYRSYGCFCIESFEKNNSIDPSIGYVGIKQYFFRDKSSDDIYKLKGIMEAKRRLPVNMDGNHMCMCMIIKYALNPQILNLVYIISYEMDALSIMSRKYEKYSQPTSSGSQLVQMAIIMINFVNKLSKFIETRYKSYFVVSRDPVYLRCYCTYNDDSDYYRMVSTVLVISSMIENIWTMDPETLRMSIDRLSILITEFEKIDSQNNKSTYNNCNSQFNDIINILLCKPDVCKLSSKLQLISDFVTFCSDVPVLETQIRNYIRDVSLVKIDLAESEINRFISMNLHNTKPFFESLLLKYRSIDGSNNLCNKYNNQCCVLSSNIVIIVSMLISVKIKSKLYPTKCQQLKDRLCLFLKSVCNCNSSECCLKQLIDSKDQVCNCVNSNCDDWVKKCVESCCDSKCCSGGCPCKQLKDCCDKLKELCCQNPDQNGLCKLLDVITKCPGKRDGNSCKKCVCCKLVVEGILILQNMFRSNVRIISKNIIVSCKYLLEIMDKIKKTNNSHVIIKSVFQSNSTYIKRGISLVKNSYGGYGTSLNTNLRNIKTVRNWGYDTQFEHSITPDNGFTRCDNYPRLYSNSYRTDIHNTSSFIRLTAHRIYYTSLNNLVLVTQTFIYHSLDYRPKHPYLCLIVHYHLCMHNIHI